jgi:hypothetical protein
MQHVVMSKRLYSKKSDPLWNRFTSCAVLGLYVLALVVLPALHGHGCEQDAATCCEHSESSPIFPVSSDTCSICEFAHLAIPFFEISEPLPLQADTCSEIFFTVSIPSVAEVTVLPPCRAPPVF